MTSAQNGPKTAISIFMEGGRPQKAEQLYVGFTSRNFSPCGAQVEKV